MKKEKVSFRKALWLVFFSTCLISGGAWLAFFGYSAFWKSRAFDPKFNIIAIVQTGPDSTSLKTSFLAELLGLSVDKPTNLYRLNLSLAKEKLLAFPLIQEATLKRIPPATLYIDYTVRKPVAFFGDVSNAAIDQEGYLIPFSPFFSPKKLPEITLGVDPKELFVGQPMKSREALLSFEILREFQEGGSLYGITPLRIDLSLASALSLGEEAIVLVVLEGVSQKRTLILSPLHYEDGIKRYLALREASVLKETETPLEIDLRLPRLGYITKDPL